MSENLQRLVFRAVRFLSMIDPKRFLDEEKWLNIGRALYGITKGHNSGLLIWITYTDMALDHKETPNFILPSIEESCTRRYRTFSGCNILTLRCLARYARLDNGDMYDTWHKKWCDYALKSSLDKTHTKIARFIYRCNWLDIAYCQGMWYKYHDHRWIISPEKNSLVTAIINNVITKYRDYAECHPKKLQIITEIINNLSTKSFRCDVINEVNLMFNYDTSIPDIDRCVDSEFDLVPLLVFLVFLLLVSYQQHLLLFPVFLLFLILLPLLFLFLTVFFLLVLFPMPCPILLPMV